jgi:Mrp family chromosome partitioning ATPase
MKRQGIEIEPNIEEKSGLDLYPSSSLDLSAQVMGWMRPTGTVMENIRLMVGHIQKNQAIPKRLSVVSSLKGEGVTSVCLALGSTLVNDYSTRVCIVDLNWHSPSSPFEFISNTSGVSDILKKRNTIESVIKPLGENGLFLLPAGELDENERPSVARNKALSDLLLALDSLFDHLILDIPAILSTSDAVPLAGHGSACCLVVQQGVTPLPDIKMALSEISHLPILGVVINRADLKAPHALIRLFVG